MPKQDISPQKSLLARDQSNYNQLLMIYNHVQIQQWQASDRLRSIQPAEASEQPRRRNILLAAAISVSALCLIVLFHDWLRSSSRATFAQENLDPSEEREESREQLI